MLRLLLGRRQHQLQIPLGPALCLNFRFKPRTLLLCLLLQSDPVTLVCLLLEIRKNVMRTNEFSLGPALCLDLNLKPHTLPLCLVLRVNMLASAC